MARLSRRDFLKLTFVMIGAAGSLPYYMRHVEPFWPEVRHVRLPLSGLPEAFRGFRLVHVSDWHIDDEWRSPSPAERWVDLILAQKPHAVAVTGDWITNERDLEMFRRVGPSLRRMVEQIPDGVFFVLGNHDHWTNPVFIRESLTHLGLIDLKNTAVVLQSQQARLAFAGVDDPWSNRADWRAAHQAVPEGVPAILLAHEPDFADETRRWPRFVLQLSGHSHGGQVCLPGQGPLVLPKHAHKYPMGLYNLGSLKLYTNRGLGVVPPKIRLFCRPEITVLTLLPG